MSVESSAFGVERSAPAGAVFLSYASQDADAARRIAEALRAAGLEVWFDQNELVGGDAWDAKIRGQIASCALFVPIISAKTQARLEGYFRREWKQAAQRTHDMAEEKAFLLPIVIDDTRDGEATTPAEFKAVQWTRMPGGLPTPQLVAQVKHLIGAPYQRAAGGQAAVVLAPSAPGATRSPRSFGGWAAAAVVVVLVGVAYFALRHRAGDAPADGTKKADVTAGSVTASGSDKSIAVLPFVNMGADKGDEYLGDGMTEELLHVLAKVKGLRVPGRTSSFAFKGKTEDGIFRKVGEQLHVTTVLEGSVRKIGDKLRITAQLINVADGFHLWSETYDGDMKDILAFQSDVAQRVVGALRVQLGAEETRALAKKPTENVEAHRLYLLGRFHFVKGTQDGWVEAERCFNEALRLDPKYALAYCGLADVYGFMGGFMLPGRVAWAKEKEMAQKALALEPDLADAHLSLGIAFSSACEWRAADAALTRAIALNPNLALAYDQYAMMLVITGRMSEGYAQTKKAIELDPLSPILGNNHAFALMLMRRYDASMAQSRRTIEAQPNDAFARVVIGWCLIWQQHYGEAVAEFRKGRSLDEIPWFVGGLGYALAVSGDRAGAEQILREIDEMAKQRFVSAGTRVFVYLGLGQYPKALDWLEKAYEEQDGICWMLKTDRVFDPVRNEPRFRALLKKAGFEE